jgi:hypothetical protein
MSIYSNREGEQREREQKGSVMKHSRVLIDDDSDHICKIPVTI